MSRRHKNQEPIKSPSLKFHQAGAGFQGEGIILTCLSLSGKTLTTVAACAGLSLGKSHPTFQVKSIKEKNEKKKFWMHWVALQWAVSDAVIIVVSALNKALTPAVNI